MMPIKGEQILRLVMLKLKEAGLKEGDQLEMDVIEKTIKLLGFYDMRTLKKYSQAVLESSFVRVEQTFKEVKRLRGISDWGELKRRCASENWNSKKADVYKMAFLGGSKSIKEEDWDLIDPQDIIIEKIPGDKKVFIKEFP